MDEFNILPIYREGFGEISNGLDYKVPEYCKKNCEKNNRCIEHYKKMAVSREGVYLCPYGFCSYVCEFQGEKTIFTSLRIVGNYNKSKVMPKIKKESKENREIKVGILNKYVEAYKVFNVNINLFNKHQEFVNKIFHDIRKFNQQIKLKNNRIYRKSQQNNKYTKFKEFSKSIEELSWLISLRMNNYNLTYNEELMKADIKSAYNIYSIIYKVKRCLEEKANQNDLKIHMNADRDCREVQAYDCIELLPFLFIDNAIKYSPKHGNIYIIIKENSNRQHIIIKSIGPQVESYEKEHLCDEGYRGKNAKIRTDEGMGIGLYTASSICQINNIKLSINSGEKVMKEIDGIKYAEFVVDFWIEL